MPDIDDIFDDEEDVAEFTKPKPAATMPVQAPIMRNVRPVPVAEWPKMAGEQVLLWVAFDEIVSGHWELGHWSIAGNCWVRGSIGGIVTHVAPLPPAPEDAV